MKPKIYTKKHWTGILWIVEFGDDPKKVLDTMDEAKAYAARCLGRSAWKNRDKSSSEPESGDTTKADITKFWELHNTLKQTNSSLSTSP